MKKFSELVDAIENPVEYGKPSVTQRVADHILAKAGYKMKIVSGLHANGESYYYEVVEIADLEAIIKEMVG